MKRTLTWRLKHLIHNCVAHPLLPLAEALDSAKLYQVGDLIFKLHDLTAPDDDKKSTVKYLS